MIDLGIIQAIKSLFFRRYGKREQKQLSVRYRDPYTGRFVKTPEFRTEYHVKVGLNGCVKHGVYRNFIQERVCATRKDAEAAIEELRGECVEAAERWLGFSLDEWNWNVTFGDEIREVDVRV